MCGIAGIVAPGAKGYAGALERMTARLAHRGPDGSGSHFFGECGLGHRRLSIVDLGTGHQPMLSAGGRTAITFNGEIYGYRELRDALEGYPFRTSSDTEVILALHRRYGDDFVGRLPGMFAFGLWNEEKQELLCARDRFGEKPFYYAVGEKGEFVFASEIKAILASGLVNPVLNREAVAHYLKYLYVHPLQTIYRNIHVLPPAHVLRVRNGSLAVERYWSLPETQGEMGIAEAAEEFDRLLDRAVARQLVADVTVGAFLSGGLDSSTIVACAARHQSQLKTFAFGFEDAISELPYAREVAELYGTDHTELLDRGTDIADLLMGMQDVFDEPFADSSNIPTYLIAKLAREHVKVVLTGDGGDELFGGYSSWYRPLVHMEKSARVKQFSRMFLVMAKAASRSGWSVGRQWGHRLRGMSYQGRYNGIVEAHRDQQSYFSDDELVTLGLPPATKPAMAAIARSGGSVDDAMRMDIGDYLPGDILVKIDRASMANGLELRAPFLDIDFASFCIALPWSLKISGSEDKIILREAAGRLWPQSLRGRGKQGFGAPVTRWLARPSVRRLKEEYLGERTKSIFSLISREDSRPIVMQNDYRTWALLVLSLWMERHRASFSIGGGA